MVRLLMSWDIQPGQEEALLKFIKQEFARGVLKEGLSITDFWSTVVGSGPQMTFGVTADDLGALNKVLASPAWHALHRKLLTHVVHFTQKVMRLHNRYQM